MRDIAPIRCRYRRRSGELGFTFLGLMLIIAILGVILMSVGEVWHFARQREKEQELLFVGDQYRRAIKSYYDNTPVSNRQQRYPLSLDELLKDPRYPTTRRHLRKAYDDPIRGVAEWGLVRNPAGGIIGVHSLSEETPVKQGEFGLEDMELTGQPKYSDWVFKYLPPQPSGGVATPH